MGGIFSLTLTGIILGELVALAATFIWKGPEQRVAPQVQHVAPQAQPARVAQAAPQAVQARLAVANWWSRAMRQLAPLARQGGNLVSQSPSLWAGVLLLTTAGCELLFTDGNWKMTHIVIPATAVAGIACILNHRNQLNACLKKLAEKWVWIWLTCSVVTILQWRVHDWEWETLAGAIVATIAAIISLGNWWGAVGNGVGEVTKITFQAFANFLKENYGVVKILFAITFATLAIIVFFYFGGELLFDDELAQARVWSFIYLVVFLCLMGALIYKIHKKMKK